MIWGFGLPSAQEGSVEALEDCLDRVGLKLFRWGRLAHVLADELPDVGRLVAEKAGDLQIGCVFSSRAKRDDDGQAADAVLLLESGTTSSAIRVRLTSASEMAHGVVPCGLRRTKPDEGRLPPAIKPYDAAVTLLAHRTPSITVMNVATDPRAIAKMTSATYAAILRACFTEPPGLAW